MSHLLASADLVTSATNSLNAGSNVSGADHSHDGREALDDRAEWLSALGQEPGPSGLGESVQSLFR